MGNFKSKVAVPIHFPVPTSRTNLLTEGTFTVAVRYGHKSRKVEVKEDDKYYGFFARVCCQFDLKGDAWELFREEDDKAFPRLVDHIVEDAFNWYHGNWDLFLEGPTVRAVGIIPNDCFIIRRVNEDEPNAVQKATQTEFDFPKYIKYKCIRFTVTKYWGRANAPITVKIYYSGTCTLGDVVNEIARATNVSGSRMIHMLRCIFKGVRYDVNSTVTCDKIGLVDGSTISYMLTLPGGGGEIPNFDSESVRVQTAAKAVGWNMTPPPQVNNPPKAKT